MKDQLFYNEVLLIFVEGFIDFVIVILLFVTSHQDNPMASQLVAGVFGVMVFILIPGALVWMSQLPSSQFKDEAFEKKWSALFEDVKTDNF